MSTAQLLQKLRLDLQGVHLLFLKTCPCRHKLWHLPVVELIAYPTLQVPQVLAFLQRAQFISGQAITQEVPSGLGI
jgi:hypothetical protein